MPTHAAAERLAGNTGQPDAGSNSVMTTASAQKFTTGSERTRGYSIESVAIRVAQTSSGLSGSGITITINSASGDDPGPVLYTIPVAATQLRSLGVKTFDAPDGARLAQNTDYFLVVTPRQASSVLELGTTRGNDEDSDTNTGWSIADEMRVRSGTSWVAPTGNLSGASLEIRINGEQFNTAPDFGATGVLIRYARMYNYNSLSMGEPVTATDAEGDAITYSLESLDGNRGRGGSPRYGLGCGDNCADGVFGINSRTGQIRTLSTKRYGLDRYRVRVTATDALSRTATITVFVSSTGTPPDPPRNLTASSRSDGVQLSWDAPATSGSTALRRYEVQYIDHLHRLPEYHDSRWQTASSRINPGTTTYRDSGPTAGTVRTYRVRAYNRTDSGQPSNLVTGRRLYGPQPTEISVPRVHNPGSDGLRITLDLSEAARTAPWRGWFRVTVDGRVVPIETVGVTSAPSVRIDTAGLSIGRGDRIEVRYTDPQAHQDDSYIVRRRDGTLTMGGYVTPGPSVLESSSGVDTSSWCMTIKYREQQESTRRCALRPTTSNAQAATPLTARWSGAPISHNGTAFTLGLEFSEAVAATAAQVRSAVSATGASVTAAALAPDSDKLWNLTVTPSGTGYVSLLLVATGSCTATGAICTSDGRGLLIGIGHSLPFFPWLAVADAEATEAPGATMDFTVTLAPAMSETVTVDYATSDGTATSPSDYTASSGTVTFAPGETSKTVSVPIVDDDQPDSGETFTLTLSNANIALITDAEATGTIRNTEAAGLTASFLDLPATHDGKADIVFELRFNQNLATNFSYETLRDHAFTIANGTVEAVERIVKTGAARNRRWTVTVDPGAAGETVGISLPATTDCSATGAICNADNQPLSAGVSRTVAPRPESEEKADLTVAWTTGPPAVHDGSTAFTFAFSFSENLATGFSYKTIRDHALSVTQGGTNLTPHVARKVQGAGNDQHWTGTVTPSGRGDISIGLSASASCGSEGAICTDDGRALSSGLAAKTVKGPPGLSVANAEATEGANASMSFTVTLSRAASARVTVDYATSDGTATEGADYTETSGTLAFAVGETSKTVSVPILPDTIDDDGETFTLTLSNASGGNAWLANATATGTIRNSGGTQQAWITRFGRGIAAQAVDAVGGRLEGGGSDRVRVGGFALDPGAETALIDEDRRRLGLDGFAESPAGRTFGMSGRDLLRGSAFNLSAGGEAGGPAFGVWGRFETGAFEARDDEIAMDGDVITGFLGADIARERWLAGLAVSFSSGEGDFAAMEGEHAGTIESELTSLYPYARLRIGDRMSAWGLVGFGAGELTIEHGQGSGERSEIATDISMRMGALGVRGEILAPSEPGGLALAVKSDAFWVQTESDEVRSASGYLGAADGEASRVRLIAEGSTAFDIGGGTLTPAVEIGLRHDDGDAETGTGIEAGAALRYEGAGFSVEASVRTLLAHAASDYEEWGAAGALRIDPGSLGEGFSLTLAPRWGAAGSGVGRLWGLADARALAPEGGFEAGRALETELGYGLGLGGTPGVVTPYAGLSLAEGGGRSWRTGARWAVWPDASLGLEATWDEAANDDAEPVGALMLRGRLGW